MMWEKQRNGSWLLSDIIGGYRVWQVYYGYTLKESKVLFRAYCKDLEASK